MYTEGQEFAKIGRVTVDIKGKSYRLRFTYPERNRHEFSVSRVSPEGWTTAIKAAQLINRDIDLGDFDETYSRYSPKHAKKLAIASKPKEYTLLELWERYKELNKNRVAQTTQKRFWKEWDVFLRRCPKEKLALSNSEDFVRYYLSLYSPSTVGMFFRTCLHPCVNQAVRQGLISKNPYKDVPLPKIQKAPIECFEPDEVKAIIAAFYSDEFCSKFTSYRHSRYAAYVEFLALTGCRPSEAIALTRDDVWKRSGKTFIRFNKVYSKGTLLSHTKTHEIRLFPCNKQLEELVDSVSHFRQENKLNLLFPSQQWSYIDQDVFRGRYWKKIVDGLVAQGKVRKYLKPYCLRHSFVISNPFKHP
jgi:integrase